MKDTIADSEYESTDSESQDTLLESATGVRPIFANTPIPFPATNPSPAFTDTREGEVLSSEVAESDGASALASVHLTIVGSASLVTNTPLPYKVSLTSESSPVDDSTKVTLKNLIIANATGESTESRGNDILTGQGNSEPSGETEKKLKQLRPLGVAFTDTLNDELSFAGFPRLSAIQRSQEAVSEFTEVSSVEATLLLPAVQSAREHARFSGNSSSNGAWVLPSTFGLTSGEPFSSQIAVSGGRNHEHGAGVIAFVTPRI
ncbi:hypothetical protein QUB08_31015 [Microcoleus sp. BR0-C5]|uniref:hypothetical protein n=1 Tax=Microcoleus sp. BR0-C5 TaxID=2818713 RepID=UPI002FD35C5D